MDKRLDVDSTEDEQSPDDTTSTMMMLGGDGRGDDELEDSLDGLTAFSESMSMEPEQVVEEPDSPPLETPLPMKKLFVILCILFSESFAATMLFSFVSYMVEGFPGIAPSDTAYYVGWLASSFFVGQFFSSFFWGYFSDRYGRRPTLIIGLSGTFFSMIWFGFSRTFNSAILARLLGGLLNSNFSIGKAVMSDMTDSTNRARGFSYIGMMWGIGSIIGPFLGGSLSDPAKNISCDVFCGTVFETHPYFLPTVVASSVCAIGLVGTLLFLPETITLVQHKKEEAEAEKDLELQTIEKDETEEDETSRVKDLESSGSSESDTSLKSEIGSEGALEEEKESSKKGEKEDITTSTNLVMTNESVLQKVELSLMNVFYRIMAKFRRRREAVPLSDRESWAGDRDFPSEDVPSVNGVNTATETPNSSELSRWEVTKILLSDRTVQKACGLYAILSIIFVTLDEVFPLWLKEPPERGGFGFHELQIGVLWFLSGISLLFFQLFIYPRLAKRFGPLNCFKSGAIISTVSIFLLPVTGLVAPLGPTVIWPVVGIVMVFRTTGGTLCFTSANILVNASASGEHSGKVNGLANSCAGLMRAIGPAFGGVVFGWSTNYNIFPIDRHFVFGILSLLCLVEFFVASLLPSSLAAYGR